MHKYFLLGVMIISVMSTVAMEQKNKLYGDEVTLYSGNNFVAKSIMSNTSQSIYILENNNGITDSIKELDIKSGKELHVFENYKLKISNSRSEMTESVVTDFIYDQGKIIVGTENGKIRIWNSYNKNLMREWTNQDRAVKALVMLKNSNKLCSVLNKEAKIWDIETSMCEQEIRSNYCNSSSCGCIQKNGLLYVADKYRLHLIDEKSGCFKNLLNGTYITAFANDENSEHRIFVSIWENILEFDIRKFSACVNIIKNNRMVSALRVFDGKLYVGRSSGSSVMIKNPYPNIKAFNIGNRFNPEVNLPGKDIVYHLEVNKRGLFVSSEKGLTFFPTLLK